VAAHQLGSTSFAHNIIVMDAYEILDIGTYEELLARSEKNAKRYTAKAQWNARESG
jgi:ABC-type multidrug transport system fused ATPase/permease subunit